MKTFVALFLPTALWFSCLASGPSLAEPHVPPGLLERQRGNPTGSPSPYEIVLEGEKVVFDKAETVSSQVVIRDLGVKKMIAPDLYWGLSVVWDGKEYKRDPKHIGMWNGPWEILPK